MTGQRTPPEVKWTANELAALKGELQRLDQQLERVLARRAGVQARVDALSLVFGRVAPHIPLVQVPVVNVHANYGGRGNLRAWLLQTLRATYPDAVDTAALVQGAIHAFQLTPASREALNQFRRNSLGRALRKALDAGLVERLPSEDGERGDLPGLWRWRPQDQAAAELRAVAQQEQG